MRSVVDACVYHNPASETEILEYLPRGWRTYLSGGYGTTHPFGFSVLAHRPYRNPLGDKLPEARNEDSAPGSDLALTVAQHLEPNGLTHSILCPDLALSVPSTLNPQLAAELTRVYNEWTVERWLNRDDRLYMAMIANTQLPEFGAKDIRRMASNPRCVAALVAANALGKPFGHPIYHPIYEAAAEVGLPVILHGGGDTTIDVLTQPVAGGKASTYTDYYALASQPLATHVVSLIGQGVFERFPDLQVLLVGAGMAWLTPLIWRYETNFKAFRRDAPWLKLSPMEYFARNVRVSTYPRDRVEDRSRLKRYLLAHEGLDDVFVYVSGYPNWDSDTVDEVQQSLPEGWASKILSGNAMNLFPRLARDRGEAREPAIQGRQS